MCSPSLLSTRFHPKQPSVPAPSRTPEGTLSSAICCLPFFQAVGKNVLGDFWREDKRTHGNVVGTNYLISQLLCHMHHSNSDELDKVGAYLCASSLHGFQVQDRPQGETAWGKRLGLLCEINNSKPLELRPFERSCFGDQCVPVQKTCSRSSGPA